jgi:hypothetical protein
MNFGDERVIDQIVRDVEDGNGFRDLIVAMYAQHGREFMGCKSPVFSSDVSLEVIIPDG